MQHRNTGYGLLSGCGLEIGALHYPAVLDKMKCGVRYLDVHDSITLRKHFTEIEPSQIIELDYIGDVNMKSVREITNKDFDFIIFNHVLEHIANPIRVFINIWHAIGQGGMFVLSVPDKDFTFDRNRQLTSFEHLLADYHLGVDIASDDHYIDFLCHVHPEVFQSKEAFLSAVKSVRKRFEHVHVWNSRTFYRKFP